jgi:hypothetical protein
MIDLRIDLKILLVRFVGDRLKYRPSGRDKLRYAKKSASALQGEGTLGWPGRINGIILVHHT